jgi:hypothetical protein
MKCFRIITFLLVFALYGRAQDIVYHSMKDFAAQKGDTVQLPATVTKDKRTINQQLLTTGGDYSITSNRAVIRDGLKRRYFAVLIDSKLYVNCKKLKIKKFRFGKCYAPAMAINDKIYFRAYPVGPAALAVVNRKIGMGAVGEAVASSAAITQRVYYELDCQTGTVEFVGKEKMKQLLSEYPELLRKYLDEKNEEAEVAGKYLEALKMLK